MLSVLSFYNPILQHKQDWQLKNKLISRLAPAKVHYSMAKKRKQQALPWCWYQISLPVEESLDLSTFFFPSRYCDREFEDEKVLINHQKAKHFKCHYCHKKLNSGSGLVIHVAQLHKETMVKIPNALDGHDTPEIEIYGMDGVPEEDLKRHREGLGMVPFKRSRLMEPGAGMLPLLAAQKAALPDLPEVSGPMPPPPPAIFKPSGTSNPVSPNSSNDSIGKDKSATPGVVSAAAVSYASPPMPAQGGYPPQYYPAPYYPGYGAPYYPPQAPPYGYPGYPPQYYPPQHPPYYAPPNSFNSPQYGAFPPTPYAAAAPNNATPPREVTAETLKDLDNNKRPIADVEDESPAESRTKEDATTY